MLGVVDMLTCAPAEKFVPYARLLPLAGEAVRESAGARDHTWVEPIHTELIVVLPTFMSVMFVPPIEIGKVTS